ncbi:unnamed protein product [Blepharisma stoltei]|uniref:Uncharacterized protein n=1 Tax=Blepharisma stoltei TaxID=1481888 RepID=A0AAU9J1M3_9CILI|nr:unnamed protein product [Blepharisma stoltei]
MAENKLKSHLDWFTWEALIRQNIPDHMIGSINSHPTKLVRTKQEHDEIIKEYLQTIDFLRKENDELKMANQAKDIQIQDLAEEYEPMKENLLLKIGMLTEKLQEKNPEEWEEWSQEIDSARIKSRVQAETLRKLESSLRDYRKRIAELESQLEGAEVNNKEINAKKVEEMPAILDIGENIKLQQRIAELEKQVEDLQSHLQNGQNQIATMIAESPAKMAKLVDMAEAVLLDSYHKLHIDDEKIKENLQELLDNRKSLRIPAELQNVLLNHQIYLEKQLDAMQELINSSDSLQNLIESFEGIEKSQIEIQQLSQLNLDKLKALLNKPAPDKKYQRKKTYLSISHAESSSAREGLDVLKDLLGNIKRNQRMIGDLENEKQYLLSNSDIGQEQEKAAQKAEEDLRNIAQLIGQNLVKTDMVGDTLIDIQPDNKLKQEMDNYQNGFEALMKKIDDVGKASVDDIHDLLNLHSSYESANIVQASRLVGRKEEEIIEDIIAVDQSSKQRPNMNKAKKVRSAKPSETSLDKINKLSISILQDSGSILYETSPEDPIFEEAKTLLDNPDPNVNNSIVDKLTISYEIIQKIQKDAKSSVENTGKSALLKGLKPLISNTEQDIKLAELVNQLENGNPEHVHTFESEIKTIGQNAEAGNDLSGVIEQVIDLSERVNEFNLKKLKEYCAIKNAKPEENKTDDLLGLLADAEELCNDSVRNAIKEANAAIAISDAVSKKVLEGIKAEAQNIANEPSPTAAEKIENICKNNKLLDKLEKLRKKVREEAQKQFNALKSELQAKEAALTEAISIAEAKYKDYESSIATLQNIMKERENMVNKLAQEVSDKELELSKLRNQINDMTQAAESAQEEYSRLDEENSDNKKNIRTLRKQIKDKEDENQSLHDRIVDLEKQLAGKGNVDEGLIDQLRKEIRELKQTVSDKNQEIEEKTVECTKIKRDFEIHLSDCKTQLIIIQKQKDEIGQLQIKLTDLEVKHKENEERSQLSAGNSVNTDILIKLIEDKDAVINQLQSQINPLVKYRKMYSLMINEKEQDEKEKEKLDIDFSELLRRIRMLTHENEQLKYKTRMIEKYQRDYLSIGQENARIAKKLEYYNEFLEKEGNANFKEMSEKLTNELSQKMGMINELKEKLDELTKEVKATKESREITLKRQIMLRLLQLGRMGTSLRFSQWKAVTEEPTQDQKEDPALVSQVVQIPAPKFERNLAELSTSQINGDLLPSIEKIVIDDRKKELEKNELLNFYRHNAVKIDKLMNDSNLFGIFEDMVDNKYESDTKDLSNDRLPKAIPEYFIEYLIRCYGNKKKTLPYLSQFVQSLKKRYDDGDLYGKLASKMLQIFDPTPVLGDESYIIIKAFKETKSCTEKVKNHIKSRNTSGGDIYFADGINYVHDLFKDDQETGRLVISLLNPNNLVSTDSTAFKIMHYLYRASKTPEELFNEIKSGPELTESDFLKLESSGFSWIPAKELLNLFTSLQPISQEKFSQVFSPQTYDSLSELENEATLIARPQLLLAILEALAETRINDIAWCLSLTKNQKAIKLPEFKELINGFSPELTEGQIAGMYDIAVMWSSDPENGVTPDSIYKILKKYQLGRLSKRTIGIRIIIKEKVIRTIEFEEIKESRSVEIEETKDLSEGDISPSKSLEATTPQGRRIRTELKKTVRENVIEKTIESSTIEHEEEEVKKTVKRRIVKKKTAK